MGQVLGTKGAKLWEEKATLQGTLKINGTKNSHFEREIVRDDDGDGDIYVMSENAVGTDWNIKKTPTLRHAAGHSYINKKQQ